jgi:hypothetical protein
MPDTTSTETKQYQCRHIFTDGHRCSSPCLRQEEFCYYHHTTRKPIANPRQRRSRRSTFHLPLPEDRSAIQSSIGQVLQRIAANDIDPRRAGLLLYGLQIASLNLPKIQPNPHSAAEPQTVEEITLDPTLGVLAPRAEIGKPEQRKSSIHLLLEKMLQNPEEEKEKQEKEKAPKPTTVPTIQATEDPTPPTATKKNRHSNQTRSQRTPALALAVARSESVSSVPIRVKPSSHLASELPALQA